MQVPAGSCNLLAGALNMRSPVNRVNTVLDNRVAPEPPSTPSSVSTRSQTRRPASVPLTTLWRGKAWQYGQRERDRGDCPVPSFRRTAMPKTIPDNDNSPPAQKIRVTEHICEQEMKTVHLPDGQTMRLPTGKWIPSPS